MQIAAISTASTPRLLLVEDDDSVRRATARLFEARGYEVSSASCGEQALAALNGELDLVILDLGIPAPGGLEICEAVRRRWTQTELPLLVISGASDEDSRVHALEAGANDFLAKPAAPAELLCRVANLLLLRRLHRELRQERDQLESAVARRTAELSAALGDLANRSDELRVAHESTLRRLASAAEFRDDVTGKHLDRMAAYSGILAAAAGLDPARCREIELAAPMHDIGKIAVPDAILFKPGRLDEDEWRVMRRHSAVGHQLLADSASPLLATAATIALSHHERWDGSGYPQGLAGEDIPLVGRIVAVADVFDALTSARPYKEAFSVERSVEILRQGAGSHLDERLVDLFVSELGAVLAARARLADRPDGEAA